MDKTILVTNDDGITSVGLIKLADALSEVCNVVIVAPDSEYSGSSAAVGPILQKSPQINSVDVSKLFPQRYPGRYPGRYKAWTVDGPPGLCVYLGSSGAFGFKPDLVVSGVNPGANVGNSVYHSGTVGAALSARNLGINGLAVSEQFPTVKPGSEFNYEDAVGGQLWDPAIEIACDITRSLLDNAERNFGPSVINLNVPNLPNDELSGWRWTAVSTVPWRNVTSANLQSNSDGTFGIEMERGKPNPQPTGTDVSALADGYVSVSLIGRLDHSPNPGNGFNSNNSEMPKSPIESIVEAALEGSLTRAT